MHTVADRLLTDDEHIELGAAAIRVPHTPGACRFLKENPYVTDFIIDPEPGSLGFKRQAMR